MKQPLLSGSRIVHVCARGCVAWQLVAIAASCSDPPTTPDRPLASLESVFVSEPVLRTSSAAGATYGVASATLQDGVSYVSLPPGAVPRGETIVVTNLRSGATITSALVDGGLDPRPIAARVGDTLQIVATDSAGERSQALRFVRSRVPPRVVRTRPPQGGRGIPLNSIIIAVFSEPIGTESVNVGTVRLRLGPETVSGQLLLAVDGLSLDFVPDRRLLPDRQYALLLTRGIVDLAGDPLEADVEILFTTADSPAGPPPAVNPDSNLLGRIVYTRDDGGLRVYTPATRADVSLGVQGVNPKFSSDGTLIVFAQTGIYVMNSDGSQRRLLSSIGGTPSFDPSGKVVAFGDRQSGIWKINVDGTGLTQLTADGGFQPAWSQDGSRIAYNSNSATELWIVNPDGTNRQLLLPAGKPLTNLVWRPSSKLLFGLQVEDSNYEVHSYDPSDAASLTRLTTRSGNDFEPSWSPDGKNISWSNAFDGLLIMNADASDQHIVVPGGRQGSWGK